MTLVGQDDINLILFSLIQLSREIHLVGCLGFSGPLRQYFSSLSLKQREKKRQTGRREIKFKQYNPVLAASTARPCPDIRTPGTQNCPALSLNRPQKYRYI